METWLKPSTLVILTVAVTAMVTSGQVSVTLDEKQRSVDVPLGSPLTLNCSLSTEDHERFTVHWYFKQSGSSFLLNLSKKIFNRSAKTSSVVSNKSRDTEEMSLKHTSSATHNDSGWYFCNISADIPILYTSGSAGTEVVVTTVSPTDNSLDWWLWILLGVSAVILIVLLVICILLRRRCRRSRAEDPIYANTRPVASKQPSPRPGMPVSKLKMSSSSQNLRNPSPNRRYEEGKRRHKQ